jgi:hypothetical protein
MSTFGTTLGVGALLQVLIFPARAADYDLVINNGHVMDPETTDDEIASVGRLLYLCGGARCKPVISFPKSKSRFLILSRTSS